jgi:hypothetical protein
MPLADFMALLPLRVRSNNGGFSTGCWSSPSWAFVLSKVFPTKSDAVALNHRSSLAFSHTRSSRLPQKSERKMRYGVLLAPSSGLSSLEAA